MASAVLLPLRLLALALAWYFPAGQRPASAAASCDYRVTANVDHMIRVEASIVVDRSPAVVWGVIGDPRRLVDWDPGVKRVELVGVVDVGSRFTITAAFLGRDRTSSAQVTVFEPGRRIGWQIDPPGSKRWWADSWIRVTYAVEPAASGNSVLTRDFQAVGRGPLGRLVEPLVGRAARRERLAEVMNVKRAAESAPPLN